MGLKIDDKYLEEFSLKLVSYKLNSAPQIKTRRIDIAGRDGSADAGTNYGNNSFSIVVSASDDNISALYTRVRTFTSWLNPKQGNRVFLFDDDNTVVRFGKLETGGDISPVKGVDGSLLGFDLSFVMNDPFVYSATVTSYDTVLLPNQTLTVVNNGGLESPFVAKVYLADTASFNPANGIGGVNIGEGVATTNIQLNVNGSYIKYTGPVYDGDEVIFDTKDMIVKYDLDNFLRYWEGDFPLLNIGNNTITAIDDSGNGLHVIIEFRERWIS